MTQRLHAAETGAGETIVLLHGFGGNHAIWNGVLASLNARTLAYDLPGHGGSLDFPGRGQAKLAARAILADLTERGIDQVHVAGHSMGGAVAALIALEAPDRISSLTLLAPGGFGAAINGPLLRRFAEAVSVDDVAGCLSAMSASDAPAPSDLAKVEAASRARPGQTAALVEIAAAITRNDRQGVIPRGLLDTLAMPVTVLWGTDDPVLPFSQTRDLPPHFELQIAKGAGHMLIGEAPRMVVDAIAAQLQR